MAKRIREKAIARAEKADKRPRAKVSYVGVSPSKVKLVLDLIRGQKAELAVAMVAGMNNASAPAIKKLIESAMANAENKGYDKSELYIAETYATPGPTMKRRNIRGRGRMDVMIKRSSHITVILDQVKE